MKVSRNADADLRRVRVARDPIGAARLFVDANSAYSLKQALLWGAAVRQFRRELVRGVGQK
jgi:L-alanine-DL-glutamate epimerase-like enolase superfamily enzyme